MKSLLLVYGALVLFSMMGDLFLHKNPFWAWKDSQPPSVGYIFIGASFVVLYVAFSSACTRIFKWGMEIEKIFRQVLTPLSYFQILVLSLLSGFVEEWFFRGLLTQAFGVIVSSMFFGLAHFIPAPFLWVWSVASFMVGLVFGLLYSHSHSLVLVALMHAGINFLLLLKVNREAHRAPSLPGMR